MLLEIEVNGTLRKEDVPKGMTMFLTSNSTWHGVVTETWPQFRPTEINVDLTDPTTLNYIILTRNTELLFQNGVESTEDCFWQDILATDCPFKCSVYFNDLPKCRTVKEWNCVRRQMNSDVWTRCMLKKHGLKFRQKDSQLQTYKEGNSSLVRIELWSMQKEIEEEVNVITFPGLIGSLGGSLGLFFGFSMFASFIYAMENGCKWISSKF